MQDLHGITRRRIEVQIEADKPDRRMWLFQKSWHRLAHVAKQQMRPRHQPCLELSNVHHVITASIELRQIARVHDRWQSMAGIESIDGQSHASLRRYLRGYSFKG